MKMKQAGIIKKPLIACPNHMLEQFAREWMHLYPNAKLLIASKEDFTKDRRKALTAKIATGDWDGIIVTHSSFERIGMSNDYQEKFILDQIKEYDDLLIDSAKDKGRNRNLIKTIEKQKAKRAEKLKELLAEDKKDNGLVFDDLGIDQLFIDECFSHDTLVETDKGQQKIGDIVNNKAHVHLKTLNLATHAIEWKPVVNWFPNKRRGQLIEVVHEAGSFICTPRHKLWVNHKGYKKAGEIASGEELLVLRAGIYSEVGKHHLERAQGKVLPPAVQDKRALDHEGMRGLQSPVLLPHDQPSQRDQEAASVLQRELQDEGTKSQSRFGSKVQAFDATNVGQHAQQGQAESRCIGMDESQQSDEVRSNAKEGIGCAESNGPQANIAGRQWPSLSAPDDAGGEDGNDHGACDQYAADQTFDGAAAKALQSRFGRPDANAGGRAGWSEPQQPESQSQRCEEGQSLIASRVVSITVLEPDSDGEYRFGGRSHSVVYDIEVADNHNYFANGVLVSNCHAFKNLETPTKMERVAGIQTGGSERAFDLLMKSKYLDEKHHGHGLVGASGTPISNSMVEMYTLQRFFDPAGLKARGIEHFDGWAATFGEVVDTMEISPDGATLKPRSRFAKFVNLPELVQMFRAFSDVQTADMLDLPRPALEGGKPQTIACPMSDEQAELQAGLVKRYERIRSQKVDPREDNALAITTDGRKLALDGRMLGAAGDFPGSKDQRHGRKHRPYLATNPRPHAEHSLFSAI